MSSIQCPLIDKKITEFKCANPSIERQIEDSYLTTLLKQAYGYQIIINGKIVGYYMLHFKRIEVDDINKILGDEYDSNVKYYIAIHIKYLAIDERIQHQGLGTVVLKGLLVNLIKLSKDYPIRLITLDAVKEYHNWYSKNGFIDFPGGSIDGITVPMYVDCRSKEDIERLKDYIDIG